MGLFDDLKKAADQYQSDMRDSYSRSSNSYEHRSDDQLMKDYKRQLDRPGMSADKLGKMQAIKDEYDSRH